jgi:FkbM family methyltransferase
MNKKHDMEWFGKNKESLDILKKQINNCDCVMEIGAFDGVDIDIIMDLWGKNTNIHTFECSPENFSVMEKNYSDYSNVVCNKLALTNFDGTTDFYLSHDTRIENQDDRNLWFKTASSLRPHTDRHKQTQGLKNIREEKITVNCKTIDTYCAENNIKPTILLIDTQGSEYEILEGAKNTLKNVDGMMLEYSTQALYTNQHLLDEIIQLLSKYDFRLYKQVDLYGGIHGEAYFIRNK